MSSDTHPPRRDDSGELGAPNPGSPTADGGRAAPGMIIEDPAPARAAPVGESDRIIAIDVLRGFALLGILVVNIQSFSMIDASLFNPSVYGDLTGVNLWVWYATHIFFDTKFMTMFSMLFGAGILLMTSRAEDKGLRSRAIHYRRMGILILFGLMHGYLLWTGDILFWYGMAGLLVYLFRKKSPRTLIVTGLVSLFIASALLFMSGWSMQYWPEETVTNMSEGFSPPQEKVDEDLAAYRGSWLEQMPLRATSAFSMNTFAFFFWGLWRVGGLMLIGMALYRLGVFSAGRSDRFYSVLIGVAAIVGIPTVVYGIRYNMGTGWDPRYIFFVGTQFNYWASVLMSLGWIGTVMLVVKKGVLRGLTSRLAAVGRMALTNYVLQTIICTTIFFGHGLGLYGSVERWQQSLFVFAIWILQLVVSPIWLRHFRFGPFEWLWRSMTYRTTQPIRRQ
ncbi:MAG: DUF418 domain-containing protein [Candidatus Latescibacterota bacterium]|nr:MAG: DUF418 domain-containing protein [Candidatus Latescibacterota bacterium]